MQLSELQIDGSVIPKNPCYVKINIGNYPRKSYYLGMQKTSHSLDKQL